MVEGTRSVGKIRIVPLVETLTSGGRGHLMVVALNDQILWQSLVGFVQNLVTLPPPWPIVEL